MTTGNTKLQKELEPQVLTKGRAILLLGRGPGLRACKGSLLVSDDTWTEFKPVRFPKALGFCC